MSFYFVPKREGDDTMGQPLEMGDFVRGAGLDFDKASACMLAAGSEAHLFIAGIMDDGKDLIEKKQADMSKAILKKGWRGTMVKLDIQVNTIPKVFASDAQELGVATGARPWLDCMRCELMDLRPTRVRVARRRLPRRLPRR